VTRFDMVLTRQGLRFRGRLFRCTIGRGGIRTDKREGDGATPTGTHRIVGMLYRPDRMGPPDRLGRAHRPARPVVGRPKA